MSLIKQWIIDQERKMDEKTSGDKDLMFFDMDEDLMFFDADRHHQMEQAMWEAYDEPTNEEIDSVLTEEEASSETNYEVPF